MEDFLDSIPDDGGREKLEEDLAAWRASDPSISDAECRKTEDQYVHAVMQYMVEAPEQKQRVELIQKQVPALVEKIFDHWEKLRRLM